MQPACRQLIDNDVLAILQFQHHMLQAVGDEHEPRPQFPLVDTRLLQSSIGELYTGGLTFN